MQRKISAATAARKTWDDFWGTLMGTWIAFFRGIGGGIRTLPMKNLTAVLEDLGLTNVRTYIQTGNVVFDSARTTAPKLTDAISKRVSRTFDFDAKVMVLSAKDVDAAAAANPVPQTDRDPRSVHLFFLSQIASSADVDAMDRLGAASEGFVLENKVFYLHTPKGFGKFKLAPRVERLLGVDATARNWRTVCKVLEIANSG